MTLDEKLTKDVPANVANAIQDIIDEAGTSDASWPVLEAAGRLVHRERERADEMRRLRDEATSIIAQMDRKQRHGCTDATYAECDK